MADALLTYFRLSLPKELASLTEPYIAKLERGEYQSLIEDSDAKSLFGHQNDWKTETVRLEDFPSWNDFIFHRLGILLADRSKPQKQGVLFCIGYAALLAFFQSNVTGPPLPFSPAELMFPEDVAKSKTGRRNIQYALLETLSIEGIAAYKLTPNVELLCLADAIFTCPPILKNIKVARWAKMRTEFTHQRLLSEVSPVLQEVIYDDLGMLQEMIMDMNGAQQIGTEIQSEFLLERATIHNHHGLDKLARADLERVKELRHFDFALTGILGKRTKFQQQDISQLVVLAKSHADGEGGDSISERVDANGRTDSDNLVNYEETKPTDIDLDDDTLLESISFAPNPGDSSQIVDESNLPVGLSSLDPSNQPQLQQLDSAILLALASSITNTSPQDGLTREETLPYATRVLEGGSSNWQIYTQALLVRSRIEGFKARTVERGLLQLQALVDQVMADTSDTTISAEDSTDRKQSTSFLPKAKEAESAPVQDRLRYIFQLSSPMRRNLEAELAQRWVELGGLRSALDIYERLEMWAEAALCWAATEREDKARRIVRRQLYHKTGGGSQEPENDVEEDELWSGPPREPPPLDAPRLYCILGDIDQSPGMYGKAWEVSDQRYARAQRSLGRYYLAAKDFVKAANAYSKSLKANQLNHSSWFALGCALLELTQFNKAVEAFSRCVQLDETDAEAWSNLAAALLAREPVNEDSESGNLNPKVPKDSYSVGQQNKQDALQALKRAASLRHDSYRIWQNVLIVSASVSPPDFTSILAAQKRIIELRGSTEGESCIDYEILDLLVQHVTSLGDKYDPKQPGLSRMVVKFVDQNIIPLITGSAALWRLVSRLALWRNRPSSALDAEEKAWRAITSQPGWETETEKRWEDVVEATVRLCDSYESLGPMERTEGMGAGKPVAKDWKFKARTAVRGILGRGKASWEGTKGWDRLKDVMDGLKN